ncbi:hypothetical protein BDZ45DRAFT_160786 [Acephala macrosclerotiorum]|nr:hypothetical protein BDZ45DRAFT_160786 [Acephala macrosclerotiorum]
MSPVSPGGYHQGSAPQVIEQGPCSKLLFPKGYLLEGFGFGRQPVYRCRLCRSSPSHFAVMLERPPEGDHTPGFPRTQSRTEVAFPFALGNFRETDIISRLVLCAPCSVLAVEYGYSPDGKPLLGALVFGDRLSASSSINRQTWLSNIDRALDRRFSHECLLQVLLAILYAKKDQAFSTDPILAGVLDIACNTLQADLQILYEAGNHHWTGRASDVIRHYLSIGIASPGCDFLNHPVDSFVLMIRMASNLGTEPRAKALFYRLILHIIEHGHALQDTDSGLIAAEYSAHLRSRISEEGGITEITRKPLLLETLCDKYLIDEEALRIFRGALDLFAMIERECGVAICLFICLFHAVNTTPKEPRQILHWFCMRPEMNVYFAVPWDIHEYQSRIIWESLT